MRARVTRGVSSAGAPPQAREGGALRISDSQSGANGGLTSDTLLKVGQRLVGDVQSLAQTVQELAVVLLFCAHFHICIHKQL